MKAAIDNLKQKPKEQKTAVAGSVATAVVAILLIGWAVFYIKHILNPQNADDLPPSSLDFNSLRDVGESASAAGDELRAMRENYTPTSPFGESRENSFEY